VCHALSFLKTRFDETNARCALRVNGETWWEGNTGESRVTGYNLRPDWS